MSKCIRFLDNMVEHGNSCPGTIYRSLFDWWFCMIIAQMLLVQLLENLLSFGFVIVHWLMLLWGCLLTPGLSPCCCEHYDIVQPINPWISISNCMKEIIELKGKWQQKLYCLFMEDLSNSDTHRYIDHGWAEQAGLFTVEFCIRAMLNTKSRLRATLCILGFNLVA